VAANLKNGGSSDEYANHGCGKHAVAEEGADGLPPGNRLDGNDVCRSSNDAFLFQLGAKRNPNSVRRSNLRRQLLRRVHETGEVRNVIAAIAALRQMRAGLFGKRLQPLLLQHKFYVFALHGTSLRG